MNKDSLQLISSNTQTFIDILKILIWPSVAIIVVLLLKKSISDLLGRITKIGYGKLGAEANHPKQDVKDKTQLVNENIQKTLGLFSQPTLDRMATLVSNESKFEELDSDADKVQALNKYSQALYIVLSFERLYNVIFGSQLHIIENVNSDETETKATLRRYYDKAADFYPEFYATYSYDDYFQFLITFELIVIQDDGSCQITWLGRDFLKYLVQTGKSIDKRL